MSPRKRPPSKVNGRDLALPSSSVPPSLPSSAAEMGPPDVERANRDPENVRTAHASPVVIESPLAAVGKDPPTRTDPTHIKDLHEDPQNRRKHNPRNVGMIGDGLQKVGAARSIVIDEDDVVLAGNGVIEAAAAVGITRVRVIEADGNEIIAVRRSGLTDEQKRELAIYDNRTAELAEWNPDQLRADKDGGLDLQPWFTEAELSDVLEESKKKTVTFEATEVADQFQILVTCTSEGQQAALLERLLAEGYQCRAMLL